MEVIVTGFFPYFYVEASEEIISNIIETENEILKAWIIRTEACQRKTYFGAERKELTRIIGRRPYQVPKIRTIFSQQGLFSCTLGKGIISIHI